MPQYCAIKSCKNSRESGISLFKVPADDQVRANWEESLNFSLRSSHLICEKHFEEKYISRKCEQYIGGKLLFSFPYKYPHLRSDAVPTLFGYSVAPPSEDEVSSVSFSEQENTEEYPSCKAIDISYDIAHEEDDQEDSIMKESSTYDTDDEAQKTVYQDDILVPLQTDSQEEDYLHQNESINNDSDFSEEECYTNDERISDYDEQLEHVNSDLGFEDFNSSTNPDSKDSNENKSGVNTDERNEDCDVIIYYPNKEELPGQCANDHSYTPFIGNEPQVISSVTRININGEILKLPYFWGINEKVTKLGKRLIFSSVNVEDVIDPISVLLEKCVIINLWDKKIHYYVRNCQVNVKHGAQLPDTFSSANLLIPLLMKFARLRACEGLGLIDELLIKEKDPIVRLPGTENYHRHIECHLVSNCKRCDLCKTTRRNIMKRVHPHSAYINNENVTEEEFSSNNEKLLILKKKFHQSKKISLRKKISRRLQSPCTSLN